MHSGGSEVGYKGRHVKKGAFAFLSLRGFKKFCSTVVRQPRIHIVLPLLIAIILSSRLFSIVISPGRIWNKFTENQYISKVELLDNGVNDGNNFGGVQISEESKFVLLQVWIRCIGENFQNVLGKKTLLESLALQNKLLDDVDAEIRVDSPFRLWNHSLKRLKSDPAPLQTVNSNLLLLPQYSFFGTWKINGLVSSASGITISILVNGTDFPKLFYTLGENVLRLNEISNVTSFHIFPPVGIDNNTNESLRLYMIKLGGHYKVFFLLLHIAVFIHLFFSMKRLQSTVKSVVGITLAILAQLFFTIGSVLTLTNFCLENSNENITFSSLSCAVIFFTMNEQIRLLEDTSGSSFAPKVIEDPDTRSAINQANDVRGSHTDKDFVSCAALSQMKSTKSVFFLSLVIALLIPFSRKATSFLLLALWFGHFLVCTFFTAVLCLDHRRLEESDLISTDPIDDNVLLDEEISDIPHDVSTLEQVFFYLRSICRNRYSVILTIFYLVLFNIHFSIARSSSSLISKFWRGGISAALKFAKPVPNVVFDQKFIVDAAFKLMQKGKNRSRSSLLADLIVKDPFLVVRYPDGENFTSNDLDNILPSIFDASAFTSSYKLDFYYVFEFLLFVVLLLSCTLLILQKLMEKLDRINSFHFMNDDSLENSIALEDAKRNKDGKNSYLQDLPHLGGSTSPKTSSHLFRAKELYKGGHTLDIVGICTSKCPFVVSVGLDYKVLVWSPLLKPIPNPTVIPLSRKFWPLSKVVLSNDGYYIAFFGKNGIVTVWSRRHMKFVWELQLKKESQINDPTITAPLLEAFFRRITKPSMRRRLPPTSLRPELKSRSSSMTSLEYAAALADGGIDAAYEKVDFTHENPDENEELVFVTQSGYIYSIQTTGDLRVEKLTSSDHSLKSCKLLLSPRVNDRLIACDEVGDLYVSTVVNNKWRTRKLTVNYGRMLASSHFSRMEKEKLPIPSADETRILAKTDYTIELVSFVGLILRVIGKQAELIDAMTGCVIRTFGIGLFKPHSLRVFHDNPTHCRFCGSASVASFSIAYTSSDNGRVALHTFKLESRTKNSICLRVERDPREIRCLGMESAFETVYYFYNAEDWCVTDNNMLIGIRRVPQNIRVKTGATAVEAGSAAAADEDSRGLIRRKLGKYEKESKTTANMSNFRIHNIWEGWTMTANGKICLQKIPVGVNGLIVNRLGPLTRYGAKAVIVGFANIMNMFYIGHEELIFNPEKEDANKEELSLRFVNKRRDRLSNKKLPLNYSSL